MEQSKVMSDNNYVTDKNYYMDKRLKFFLDMIIKDKLSNAAEDDALILTEGEEGTGKSSMAGHVGYYIAHKTGRSFSGKSFYLNTDEMLKFAAETYRQIIIWDEPAISGLSDEWWNKEQRKLKKLLTLIRQHQHCYIFNFARFNKFSEFFIVERSIAMIKTFKKNRTQHGHFLYFNTKGKEALMYDWVKKHQRNFEEHALFVGRFFTPLEMFMTTEEYIDYRQRKDQAILNILDEDKGKVNLTKEKLLYLRWKVAKLSNNFKTLKTKKDFASELNLDPMELQRWANYDKKYSNLEVFAKENQLNNNKTEQLYYNTPQGEENDSTTEEQLKDTIEEENID